MNLLNIIFHNLKKEIDFKEEKKWILGFSGGPDSVFLLEILMKFKERENLDLEIILVHINHLLRGENSDNDEFFSRKTAQKYNLKIYVERAEIEKLSLQKKIGLEEAGREIRHSFFKKIQKLENCSRILTAHNKDDQIETFLFRLMRGTSLEGLEGIAFIREDYLRPINSIYKKDIVEYLDSNKIEYRIDESNMESDFTRNSIRLELIPFIEKKYNPKFKDKIHNLIGEIGEVNKELKLNFKDYLCSEKNAILLEKLKNLSNYNIKKIVSNYIYSFGLTSDRYKLEKIIEILNGGGTKKITISNEFFIVKDYTHIYIEKKEIKNSFSDVELTVPGKIIFGDYEIEAKLSSIEEKISKNIDTILTNFKKNDTLVIR
ncbi:MAG: tRNA lysidine(34) synthetase TilS, partial [Fusobacteriaceae bacterium]